MFTEMTTEMTFKMTMEKTSVLCVSREGYGGGHA